MKEEMFLSEITAVLRKRYVLALSITALLVFLSQVIIQFNIHSEAADSTVINIAGRQRMLSQRITMCALGLYLAGDDEEKAYYLEELKESVDLWEQSQKGLLNGDEELGLPGRNSAEVRSLYSQLDPTYRQILFAARGIINGEDGNRENISNNLEIIKDNEQSFLKRMDAIVFQYNKEADHKVFVIRITEVILMFVIFVVLGLEARLIFRPAERSLAKTFEEIHAYNDNIRKLFEIAPAALFLMGLPDLKVLQMNTLAEVFTGGSDPKDKLESLLNYFENNLENDCDLIRKIVEGETFADEEAVLKAGDSLKVVLVSGSTIYYESTPAIILSMMDISKQKNAEGILRKYADTDELTGLLNRRSGKLILNNAVERSKEERESLAVSFCDIDGLKVVNDTFGHEEGDWYILSVAQAIQENLREEDFAFRYGGDEIVVIHKNCDEGKAAIISERIHRSIERKRLEAGKSYNMSISIGTVIVNSEKTTTADRLIAQADNLMYQEKKRKKLQRIN